MEKRGILEHVLRVPRSDFPGEDKGQETENKNNKGGTEKSRSPASSAEGERPTPAPPSRGCGSCILGPSPRAGEGRCRAGLTALPGRGGREIN